MTKKSALNDLKVKSEGIVKKKTWFDKFPISKVPCNLYTYICYLLNATHFFL